MNHNLIEQAIDALVGSDGDLYVFRATDKECGVQRFNDTAASFERLALGAEKVSHLKDAEKFLSDAIIICSGKFVHKEDKATRDMIRVVKMFQNSFRLYVKAGDLHAAKIVVPSIVSALKDVASTLQHQR